MAGSSEHYPSVFSERAVSPAVCAVALLQVVIAARKRCFHGGGIPFREQDFA